MGLACCSLLEFSHRLLSSSYYHSHRISSPLSNSPARFFLGLPPKTTPSPLCHSRASKKTFPFVPGVRRPVSASPGTTGNESVDEEDEEEEDGGELVPSETAGNAINANEGDGFGGIASVVEDAIPPEGFVIILACVIGLLTGITVVLFNYAVHGIRDLFWDGIPSRGASWLREEPLQETWRRTLLVPACGGLIVGILNDLRTRLETPSSQILSSNLKASLGSFLKAIAASVTLGTGNSLGPEGPSVEIGASIARGVGTLFRRSSRSPSFVAAGSAAGISSGFNAAVAGCFFAVESVLWPSPADSTSSLTNTTSMVILSAVTASVVSEIGLGSIPAFTVPDYDFRSPTELPLYLCLGLVCGVVSVTLTRCTSYALSVVEAFRRDTSIPDAAFPIFGGMLVGAVALVYPEVLYWGFENVDILLESRPFVNGLPADLLLQLVAAKMVTTSLSRASGLVGGYYAPSLFIGAATGTAYGKIISYVISNSDPMFHLSALEVASPQAYGLVGMAATLSGVCQVPLTSVLLLFELTQDYRIVLPLLGAVGLSSWVSSSLTEKKDIQVNVQAESYTKSASNMGPGFARSNAKISSREDLCDLESSLCIDNFNVQVKQLEETIVVAQAMRIKYVSVILNTPLEEAVSLMLSEKQPCAMIVDGSNILIGVITLGDIQRFCSAAKTKKLLVSDVLQSYRGYYPTVWTAAPDMNLNAAQRIMNRHGVNQLPVVSKHIKDAQGSLIGLIDRDCIYLACRAMATKELCSTEESQTP